MAASGQGPGGGHGGGGGGGGGDPQITLTAPAQDIVEGRGLSEPMATFTDPDPAASASQYSASIVWAGSPPVLATITRTDSGTGGPAQFAVFGHHRFVDAGTSRVCVGIADTDSGAAVGRCATVTVEEAPITVLGLTRASTNPYCNPVAFVSDGNSAATAGELAATIDWGDGTSQPGTMVGGVGPGSEPGELTVQGCHAYAGLGPHTVTTTVADDSYVVSGTSTAWVYALTDGGTFAIGDGNASVGGAVTFSDPAWSAANVLSGGVAPEAFKGFVGGQSPACSGMWSAQPGQSGHAPNSVPAYTAVLVSSSIAKNGARIDGNTIHLALVRTDPGSAATGSVAFMIC